MSLEKTITVDRIEVIENGCVQVRTRATVLENGQPLSGNYHRHVVAPGDDYSGEDANVQAICKVAHTPEVIAAYQAAQAEQGV